MRVFYIQNLLSAAEQLWEYIHDLENEAWLGTSIPYVEPSKEEMLRSYFSYLGVGAEAFKIHTQNNKIYILLKDQEIKRLQKRPGTSLTARGGELISATVDPIFYQILNPLQLQAVVTTTSQSNEAKSNVTDSSYSAASSATVVVSLSENLSRKRKGDNLILPDRHTAQEKNTRAIVADTWRRMGSTAATLGLIENNPSHGYPRREVAHAANAVFAFLQEAVDQCSEMKPILQEYCKNFSSETGRSNNPIPIAQQLRTALTPPPAPTPSAQASLSLYSSSASVLPYSLFNPTDDPAHNIFVQELIRDPLFHLS